MRQLAEAWNTRILSGVGDCAWRLRYWHFNQFRLVRNPDGTLFPSMAEFFDIYQHIDPEHDIQWPEAGPGDPAGANVASTMMQFVYGAGDLEGESDRISDPVFPLFIGGHSPGTPEDHWELGKLQRGGVDPSTGAQYWPAGEAAQSYFRVTSPIWSPHGKSFGGYFPMPSEKETDCGNWVDTSDASNLPDYIWRFTALREDVDTAGLHGTVGEDDEGRPTVTYAGGCPCLTENHASGHVMGIAKYPFAYYVYVGTGDGFCGYNVDRLPIKDWIEGPYDGDAVLRRVDGGQLQRSVWSFTADFRGTPEQRGGHGLFGTMGLPGHGYDGFPIEPIAFPFQEFLTRQYALAPARGVQDGDYIDVQYPRVEFAGPAQSPGAVGQFPGPAGTYTYATAFTCAGVFAKATKLTAPALVKFMSGSTPFATLMLVPDETGAAAALYWLPSALRPNPLTIELPDGAEFEDGTGSIIAEATELLKYQPEAWDAYLVCRLGGTHGPAGPISAGADGRGIDEGEAAELGRLLLTNGCLVNLHGVAGAREQAAWVNDNPVYDAGRRLSRDHMRMIRRQALVGYEVKEGKSILYFKRFAWGMTSSQIDLFHAVAPPLDPVGSGDLEEGETYIVRAISGSITYDEDSYGNNAIFTATAVAIFEVTGDAQVYTHDGIRRTARKKGWTNRWVLDLETKCYDNPEESIFKPSAYSDFFPLCQRCLFYGADVPSSRFRRHIALQHAVGLDEDTHQPFLLPSRIQAQLIAPEAPTGYRYGSGSNLRYGGEDFYRSCQVYEAPIEVESCTVDDWSADQVIKVVLTKRLRAHPDAPAQVPRNRSAWNAAALAAENYRTPDNAVREYLMHIDNPGSSNCSQKIGDTGAGTSLAALPGSPFGSCYPTLFLTRLMSAPYEDGNDTWEEHDSRCVIDQFLHAETLTRACCEGFIDGETSLDLICSHPDYAGGLYDFTFEALCFQAFGGRWIGGMSSDDRPDGPDGHGPLPNTDMRVEVYNRLAACVNLLTRARLDLPVEIETRKRTYAGTAAADPDGDDCTTTGAMGAWQDAVAAGVADTLQTETDWVDLDLGTGVDHTVAMDGCPFSVVTTRQEADLRLKLDPEYIEAVPTDLRALIEDGGSGVMLRLDYSVTTYTRVAVANVGESEPCGAVPSTCYPFYDGVAYYHWVEDVEEWTECRLFGPETFEASAPPASDLFIGHCGGVGGLCRNTAAYRVGITPMTVMLPYIQVPIVDL